MIKVENIEVFNLNGAIRGMRNPLESWDKSDSSNKDGVFIIGPNDLSLALKLVKAGTDHSKFLRQIFVCFDITAPDYWWKEEATYKIGTVENSTSTMHHITSRPLTTEDFSWDVITDYKIATLDYLNKMIEWYKADKNPIIWRDIIQMLPMSFNYTRTFTANYAVLRNMYGSRRLHKLQEWRDFCSVITTLPYSELITA